MNDANENRLRDVIPFVAKNRDGRQRVAVGELVAEVCEAFESRFAKCAVIAEADVPAEHVAWADRDELRRALEQLVENAVAAMPRGGQLTVISHVGSRGLELEVAGNGEAFFGDNRCLAIGPIRRSRGLGLPLVESLAETHGGTVTAVHCPEGGAAVTLLLPHRAMKAAA